MSRTAASRCVENRVWSRPPLYVTTWRLKRLYIMNIPAHIVSNAFRCVRNVAKSEKHCLVCPRGTTRFHWTDMYEIWYLCIVRKSVKYVQVLLKSEKNNGYSTWNLHTFLIISRQVTFGMRNASDRSCRDYQNTHFMFSNIFFENRALCEIMWRKTVVPGRS
jgi:hypothetical protein